jgi:hypothetical protein
LAGLYAQRGEIQTALGEHPLGVEPYGKDASLAQRQARRHATRAVGRLRDLADDRTDRGERDDHRKATGRSDQEGDQAKATRRGDHRSDREGATGRGDHRGDRWSDRRRPLDRERDYGQERAM